MTIILSEYELNITVLRSGKYNFQAVPVNLEKMFVEYMISMIITSD